MTESGLKTLFRPMVETDLAAAAYVSKYAMESVIRSEGREPWAFTPSIDKSKRHILRTDPEGCWVAEVNGLVVGYSQGFVRGDIWFLAQLFVHPEVHAQGFGQELLRRAMDLGRNRGCSIFAVVSSTSPVAQSLYMRSGMFAFGIGYRIKGPLDALRDLPEPDGNKKIVVDCAGWQDRMAELDLETFGAERRQEHAFFLNRDEWPDEENASFALTRDGKMLGYGYASLPSFIAPVVTYEPEDQLPLFRMGAGWLLDHEATEGTVFTLSLNQVLAEALLSRGWRIDGWTFLKANRPFGKFDRYHPAGGILL